MKYKNESCLIEFKHNSLACTCLFEVGPEALRVSDMTLTYGYIDQDFLDNPVNNYLVPLFLCFGLQNVKYIQCRFRPQNAHFISKETVKSKFKSCIFRNNLNEREDHKAYRIAIAFH